VPDLAHTVISLLVAILPCTAMMVSQTEAQEMGPAQAAQHLAQARVADAKCRHLSAAEHEELRQYDIRAEIAVAGRDGAATAMAVIKAGQTAGRAMKCGAESERLVRTALDAAREAMAESDTQAKKEARASATPKPRVQQDAVPQTTRPQSTTPSVLDRFAGELMAYNIELRCRHLLGRRTKDFWRRIVARQQTMISAYGSQAVALAVSEAKAAAAAHGRCGRRTAALIRATYGSLRGTGPATTAGQTPQGSQPRQASAGRQPQAGSPLGAPAAPAKRHQQPAVQAGQSRQHQQTGASQH
jgi:hypothetical protein